jgi:hypothetical protein
MSLRGAAQNGPRVLLVSSVVPSETQGGSLLLHRHLANGGVGEVRVVSDGAVPGFDYTVIRHRLNSRVWKRLEGTKLVRWAWDMRLFLQPYRFKDIKSACAHFAPDVLLTVAHGDLWPYSARLARECGLPLVAIFHDWWPDLIPVHRVVRPRLDGRFHQLHSAADVSLCVCEGMRSALGPHPDSRILRPVPPAMNRRVLKPPGGTPLRTQVLLRYVGNLGEYGPMLSRALEAFRARADVRLEVRGANPRWPKSFQQEMSRTGLWGGFICQQDLTPWLEAADVLLVAMSFEAHARRQVETSFPSKIAEYATCRRPMVIWGPEYCSAVRWARTADHAICITDPEADGLASAVASLKQQDLRRLASASSCAAARYFDAITIQACLVRALEDACSSFKDKGRRAVQGLRTFKSNGATRGPE